MCFSSSVGKVTDLDTGIYSSHSRMPVLRFDPWLMQAADLQKKISLICGYLYLWVGCTSHVGVTGTAGTWIQGAADQATTVPEVRFEQSCGSD